MLGSTDLGKLLAWTDSSARFPDGGKKPATRLIGRLGDVEALAA
jgi:hypothetical protein